MDIEELRAKAIASMSNSRKQKNQNQHQRPQLQSVNTFPSSNVSVANTKGVPLAGASNVPTCSGNHTQKDVVLSAFQNHHSVSRSSINEKSTSNLVISFSDGESDTDSEEPQQKKRRTEGDTFLKGKDVSKTTITSMTVPYPTALKKSDKVAALRNQVSNLQKQSTTGHSTAWYQRVATSSSGEVLPQQPSLSQGNMLGQKIPKCSSSSSKSIPNDLESLRKKIATKENELKLQKHLQSMKVQDSKSAIGGQDVLTNQDVTRSLQSIGIKKTEELSSAAKVSHERDKNYSATESNKKAKVEDVNIGVDQSVPGDVEKPHKHPNERLVDRFQCKTGIPDVHRSSSSIVGKDLTKVRRHETLRHDMNPVKDHNSFLGHTANVLSNSHFSLDTSRTGVLAPGQVVSHHAITSNERNLSKNEELAVVNKELEEAEEQRKKCEHEEKLAWNALEKSRRALQAANQRCIDLYRKRECFSAQAYRTEGFDFENSHKKLKQLEQSTTASQCLTVYNGANNISAKTNVIGKDSEFSNIRNVACSDNSDQVRTIETCHINESYDHNDHNSAAFEVVRNVIPVEQGSVYTKANNQTTLESAANMIQCEYSLQKKAIEEHTNSENSADVPDKCARAVLSTEPNNQGNLETASHMFQDETLLQMKTIEGHHDSEYSVDITDNPPVAKASEEPLHSFFTKQPCTEEPLHSFFTKQPCTTRDLEICSAQTSEESSQGKRKHLSGLPFEAFVGSAAVDGEASEAAFGCLVNVAENVISQESGGTCHSNNSIVGSMEFTGVNNKRLKTVLDPLKHEGSGEVLMKEKSISCSSVDGECHEEKEATESGMVTNKEISKLCDISSFPLNIEQHKDLQQHQISLQIGNGSEKELVDKVGSENDYKGNDELSTTFNVGNDISVDGHEDQVDSHGHQFQGQMTNIPNFIQNHYESPLIMFKSYRLYSDLNITNDSQNASPSCGYVINPFWPLCKFEHRGKCNDESCSWQHSRDYKITSWQILERLQNNESVQNNNSGVLASLRTQKMDIAASMHTLKKPGFEKTRLHKKIASYGVKVPIYRVGSYLIKAENHMKGSLVACIMSCRWKLGFCQSFSLPLAIQRIIPPDMPLLHDFRDQEWVPGNACWLPSCLYTFSVDNGKPHASKKNLFQSPNDVDCWLELAISFMNADSNVDKPEGRKKALYVLSRALEHNSNSVALWVMYLHIFYRKERMIGKDDMFKHAVQHNQGSYELWLLFINSRSKLDQRLEAYNQALTSIFQSTCSNEKHSISSNVLDLVLQLLNVLSESDRRNSAFIWLDAILQMEGQENQDQEFIGLNRIFSYLKDSDACILWVLCVYFRAYGKLPKSALDKLEHEQDLPFDIEWPDCEVSEPSRSNALKLMELAVSRFCQCGDQNLEMDPLIMYSLFVNHVRCTSTFKGKEIAKDMVRKYRETYPTSAELVRVSVEICGDEASTIKIFEESILCWPENKVGIQHLWYLFSCYALQTSNLNLAKDISKRWLSFMGEDEMLNTSNYEQDLGKIIHNKIQAQNKAVAEDISWNILNRDILFAMFNWAVYTLLNEGTEHGKAAMDRALKVVEHDMDVKLCVKEYAQLGYLCCSREQERGNIFDKRLLQVLDKCFQISQLLPTSKPLSRAFCEKIKKPRLRHFVDNLLGPIPLDSSVLNLVLKTWYGPSLLPKKFVAFKDMVDFIEGCLKLAPANLMLVLSVSRLVADFYNSSKITSVSSLLWTASVLINCLFLSFPPASEDEWLEVASFLKLLGDNSILEQFYEKALSVHPFSLALWHSFFLFRQQEGGKINGMSDVAKLRGIRIQ